MKFNMTGSEKCDLFNTGDCLIEMITWTGLTVLLIEMAGLTVLLIEMAGLTTINRDGRIDYY